MPISKSVFTWTMKEKIRREEQMQGFDQQSVNLSDQCGFKMKVHHFFTYRE